MIINSQKINVALLQKDIVYISETTKLFPKFIKQIEDIQNNISTYNKRLNEVEKHYA